jgi:hypothetical protein
LCAICGGALGIRFLGGLMMMGLIFFTA